METCLPIENATRNNTDPPRCRTSALLEGLDAQTWSAEYTQQEQTCVEANGGSDLHGPKHNSPARLTHRPLVDGDDGIAAPIPSESCTKRGIQC